MAAFDYKAPADLFPARSKTGRRPVGYRRFSSAAAIEQMPGEFLDGTILEIENVRVDGAGIRLLYESTDYPLAKCAR